jgi:hypothetical protein
MTSMMVLSQADIEDKVIGYFATRFDRPVTDFSESTNLKTAFNFSDNAWAGLADTLSALDWMKTIGVSLAPFEMGNVATVGDLTTLIWKHVPKLVAHAELPKSTVTLAQAITRNKAPGKRKTKRKTG